MRHMLWFAVVMAAGSLVGCHKEEAAQEPATNAATPAAPVAAEPAPSAAAGASPAASAPSQPPTTQQVAAAPKPATSGATLQPNGAFAPGSLGASGTVATAPAAKPNAASTAAAF
ncbi:MAG: hypothetical protein OZ921_14315, partial [Sorangiineae bacterium]|nr:hypothetical protein [Sorangiineae bacterium]